MPNDTTPQDGGVKVHLVKQEGNPQTPAVSFDTTLGVSVVAEDITNLVKEEKDMIRSKALTIDSDVFKSLESLHKNAIVTPTYDPMKLALLRHENNTLSQCIHAMVVNVDGTGYDIVRKDGEDMTEEDDKKAQYLWEFFDEVYPSISFLTARRQLRSNLEETGYAYLEVLRDQQGEITFLKPVDSKLTRRLKEDTPTVITRKLFRNGKEKTVKELTTEARFAMVVGKTAVYFKEFGSSRDLNCETGQWSASGIKLDPNKKATELLEFIIDRDVLTMYGVPRWINQLPSVLGSRKAEEYNLDFFDRGGIPPAMIIVSGGVLGQESKRSLTEYLGSKATLKQRLVMIEAQPSTGDLNSSGNVRVTVERFGAERQNDSMFQKYDEATAKHVRKAFRLSPLFLGLSDDYSFATAYASYIIAEAQVFKPERDEFDEIINLNIVSEFTNEYVIKSRPLSVKDVETQLKAIELSKDIASKESIITSINSATALDLVLEDDVLMDETKLAEYLKANVPTIEENDTLEVEKGTTIVKHASDAFLVELANDWYNLSFENGSYTTDETAVITELVKTLSPPLRKLLDGYVAQKVMVTNNDFDGMSELLSCATECNHS